ncbi:putative RNA-binding Zn ribbon-like protein [Rhizobium sp. BK313]|jgi:predicted RNA-binding Zn ribbon-like protein|uniref:CGNR zinc finger domain-containing protein n=1 Tax=Rhizobium sp. BK313 TaxID=2587081 RepID=UPI00105E8945|nr:CGNR zinc finger domain-containing protein [Rhizobium sp. BK313]MBB3453767.1 putative RNA-binding Zn ribbon-like protein [Rhizobium sp. BK313]
MSFSWTPHRFSGGALALDVANSVILRHDDERRTDRFEAPGQMESFPKAAANFCAERALFGDILPVRQENKPDFIDLREAIDRYFRARVLDRNVEAMLADLLEALSKVLRRAASPDGLDAATVHSTLRLIAMPDPDRMKICRNCGWLFIDRSKNRSRAWCDMAVCGNRAKANRHYRRKKEESAS